MPPRSKRKRKQKDLASLRSKSGGHESFVDTNAFLLPENGGDAGVSELEEGVQAPKLSKSQQKKLKKIQEEKERRAKRQEMLATLSQHQLQEEHREVMRPVSSRGQAESKRDVLKRALKMERAGLDVPEYMQLYKKPKDVDMHEVEVEGDSPGIGTIGTRRPRFTPHREAHADSDNSEDEIQLAHDRGEVLRPEKDVLSSGEDEEQLERPALDDTLMRDAVARARKEIQEMEGIDLHIDSAEEGTIRDSCAPLAEGLHRTVVLVQRSAEIEAQREKLPIVGMEQEIMEKISNNDVIVLCGETGCGKTTQVPQFLYEGGYGTAQNGGIIGVTQPRRVAAVSTATRVAEELGSGIGGLVGYHVRYDRRAGNKTKLQFMTDGILLREIQDDFLIRKYNAIIIDEAHERSLNTDVLLGMLSRIVSLRRKMFAENTSSGAVVMPLKLIIMSATLRVEDFVSNSRLFPSPPPVVNVPARQYPVAVHFQRRTELDDYVNAAYKKTCQIHRKLPEGGVLVFLTGQREVELLCRKLRKAFNFDKNGTPPLHEQKSQSLYLQPSDDLEADGMDTPGGLEEGDMIENFDIGEGQVRDDYDLLEDEEEEEDDTIIIAGREGAAEDALKLEEVDPNEPTQRVWVLPLYAMLRPDQQAQVFKNAPKNHRLIIVATNIAETSLTIPGIRYVVDAGRSKQRLLNHTAGLAQYEVRWVSKASAEQRAGRAGRIGPGHCYRLYSSAVFNDTFPAFSPPEITNVPLEGLVLLLKSIGVHKVANFPFPSPPDTDALRSAEKCLISLSAIDKNSGKLTDIGKAMARLPISPRHSRLLLDALWGGLLPDMSRVESATNKVDFSILQTFAVRLVAALSIESPFIMPSSIGMADDSGRDSDSKEKRKSVISSLKRAHESIKFPDSDALSSMCALCAFEASGKSETFCRENFLLFKNLREAAQLSKQLERIIKQNASIFKSAEMCEVPKHFRKKLNHGMVNLLKKSLTAGWGDRVAKRVRSMEYIKSKSEYSNRYKAVRYECISMDEDVFLHPNSCLHRISPQWIVFSEIIRTERRPYMIGVTAIDPRWIQQSVPALCTISNPLLNPPAKYVKDADQVMAWRGVAFGPAHWELPQALMPHPDLDERCAIFASVLLDGTIFPAFGKLKKALVAPPSMAASKEMRVHKRVMDLIHALQNKQVDNVASLQNVWRREDEYLRQELRAWIQKPAQDKFDQLWPSLVQSILSH